MGGPGARDPRVRAARCAGRRADWARVDRGPDRGAARPRTEAGGGGARGRRRPGRGHRRPRQGGRLLRRGGPAGPGGPGPGGHRPLTEIVPVEREGPEAARAALERVVGEGGVALFPADTLYGLACDPLNAAAVERIHAIKGRDDRKPSAVMY